MANRIIIVQRDGKEYRITLDTSRDEELCDRTDQNGDGPAWYLHRTKTGEYHFYKCTFSQWGNVPDRITPLSKEAALSDFAEYGYFFRPENHNMEKELPPEL